MITDKERLEELKGVVSTWIAFLQEGEFPDVVDEEVEMIERLISTVEEQAQRLDNMAHVIKLKNKEMRELSNFLKKRNIPLKELSPLITAMKFMEEQQKEIEDRKDFESRRIQQVNNLIERNKIYKQALKFYADERNYEFETIVTDCDIDIEAKILDDGGEKARQGLKGESQ